METLTADVELYGKINKRPFIKIKKDADADKIADYIMQAWDVPRPSLIISLTGGAEDFNLKKEDCINVRRGLRNVMGAKGTWIISGGTNCGIMKLCGDAAQKHKYDTVEGFKPLVGIATWGQIPELENLKQGEENEHFHIRNGVGLDSNHTHFIFVDDELRDNKFGKEQEFRGKLEKALSEKSKVPIVSIVVQGGPGTLETVKYALDNKTSCAVIKGTLGAADAIASLKSIEKADLDEKIIQIAQKFANPSDLAEMKETLKSIWENQKRVRVVLLKKDGDKVYAGSIDTAILEILRKDGANRKSHAMQLELVFRWNRDDMLEKIIQKNELNVERRQKELRDTIHEIYHKSLQYNCINFVRILSDFVELNDFLPLYETKLQDEYTRKTNWPKCIKNNVSDPNLKLFVYSIAHGRLETSEIFWKRLETSRIAAALFGGKIANERMNDKKNTVEQLRRLEEIHSFYESSAMEVLNICHSTNASSTKKLLGKPNLEFGGLTCLELAERAKMNKFIAQSACQDLITTKWKDDSIGGVSPKWSWILNAISSVVFVVLLSLMCIQNLSNEIRWLEATVWAFVFTHTVEEFRQLFCSQEPAIQDKVISYYGKNRWNILDSLALFLFTWAFVLRFWNSDDVRQVAHVFYVFALLMYFMRLTSIFSLSPYLGPKLVMINKMLEDLGKFFLIALVCIIGYGVALQALVFPGFDRPAMSFFWGILFRPYFEMLGDLDLEGIGAADLNDTGETTWPYERTPVDKMPITAVAILFKALFMFFTNVLLLNLLIAIFNNRYQEVERESETLWKYNMYRVVKEYEKRPRLPPPFIIFVHFWLLLKCVKKKFISTEKIEDIGPYLSNDNPNMRDPNEKDELLDWEEYCFEDMLPSRYKQQKHD